jgi:hypothetical protein
MRHWEQLPEEFKTSWRKQAARELETEIEDIISLKVESTEKPKATATFNGHMLELTCSCGDKFSFEVKQPNEFIELTQERREALHAAIHALWEEFLKDGEEKIEIAGKTLLTMLEEAEGK